MNGIDSAASVHGILTFHYEKEGRGGREEKERQVDDEKSSKKAVRMQLGMVDVNVFARRHWKISTPQGEKRT